MSNILMKSDLWPPLLFARELTDEPRPSRRRRRLRRQSVTGPEARGEALAGRVPEWLGYTPEIQKLVR